LRESPGGGQEPAREEQGPGPKSKMSSENEKQGGKERRPKQGWKDMKDDQTGAADSKSKAPTQTSQ